MAATAAVLLTACGPGIEAEEPWSVPRNSVQPTSPAQPPETLNAHLPEPSPIPPTPTPIPPTPTPVPPTPRPAVAAQPPAPPSSESSAGKWSADQVLAELSRYSWPLAGAIATMMCESGGNQYAHNPSGATGLFQLHPFNAANQDPATNVAGAYAKWVDGGGSFYKHWTRWGGCGAGW